MDWGLVGGNPAPGDVAAINRIVQTLEDAAQNSATLGSAIRRAEIGAASHLWRGMAADVVSQRLADLEPLLAMMERSHAAAATAMLDYARRVAELQAWAGRELAKAQQAESGRAATSARQHEAQRIFQLALSQRDQAKRQLILHQSQLVSTRALDPVDAERVAYLVSTVAADQRRVSSSQVTMNDAAARRDEAGRVLAQINQTVAAARRQCDVIREVHRRIASLTERRVHDAAQFSIPEESLLIQVGRYVVDVTRPNSATEAYVSFLKGLSSAASMAGFIPVFKPVALAVAAGLDVVILTCRAAQALYGQRSWSSVGGEAVVAAASLVSVQPFGKVLGSSSILGQVKRFVWYEDARTATGAWRMVHVGAKVPATVLAKFPGASGQTVYRAAALLSWGEKAGEVVDVGSSVYFAAQAGRWGDAATALVDGVTVEGMSDHLVEMSGELMAGDLAGLGNDGAFMLGGSQGEKAYVAAQSSLISAGTGDLEGALRAGQVFVFDEDTAATLQDIEAELSDGDLAGAWAALATGR